MKIKNILWAVGIIALIIWAFNLAKTKTPNREIVYDHGDTSSIVTAVDTTMEIDKTTSHWSYSEDEDKMTSKKTYYAELEAIDKLHFDFPYDGGSTASLLIRKRRGEIDVMLRISKGQFTGDYENKTVRVRFGKSNPRTYSYSEASDGSNDVIFINETTRFISNLKKFQSLIIEAEFYQEGYRQIEFNISDFKWNH